MSTKGDLTGFSLPEILQILGSMKKTGGLKVVSAGGEAEVFFHEGAIVFAGTPKDGQPLPSRLLGLELVTPEQLAEALTICESEPDKRLGDVLVVNKTLSADALKNVVTEQVQEAICEMLDWPDADYHFAAGKIPGELNGAFGVEVSQALAEANRRQAEWAAIREIIPTLESRLDLNGYPSAEGSIALTLEEWQLICHLRPGLSVNEFSGITHRQPLALCRLLCRLIERGLIHVTEVAAPAKPVGEEAQKEAPRQAAGRKYIKKALVAEADGAINVVPLEWLSYYQRLDEKNGLKPKKTAEGVEKVIAH